jgi:hypothetical protein
MNPSLNEVECRLLEHRIRLLDTEVHHRRFSEHMAFDRVNLKAASGWAMRLFLALHVRFRHLLRATSLTRIVDESQGEIHAHQ